MAFHPFRTFQKQRKTWLAGLTIMTMFLFILSGTGSMGGDFFGWALSVFGQGRGHRAEVARLHGRRVTVDEVNKLRANRQMANEFMSAAVGRANENVFHQMQEKRDKFGEFSGMVQFYMGQLEQGGANQDGVLRGLRSVARDLDRQSKVEEAKVIEDFLAVLERRNQMRDRTRNELYFGGTMGLEDLLDFMLWQQQANQFGIRLVDEDINAEFKAETFGRLSREQSQEIFTALAARMPRGSMTWETLNKALGEEFRVRLAKEALLGSEGGASDVKRVPDPATPQAFWDYYLKNRTTLKVAVLPVPVKDFVAQVKEEPTDGQLRALFDRWKDEEAAPDRDRPGFKQPRRVEVEWVSTRPDLPYFQQGAAIGSALSWLTLPPAFNVHVYQSDYDMMRYRFRAPPLPEPFALSFYTSRPKAADAASAVGLAVGGWANGNLGVEGLASYQALAAQREAKAMEPSVVAEAKRRAPQLATLVLAGSALSPLEAAGAWSYAGEAEQYLPVEAVQDQVFGQMRDSLARTLMSDQREKLLKELEKRRGQPEELRKWLAENAKPEKGFEQFRHTEKPRDIHDLGDDPAMQPLKEAYQSYATMQGMNDPGAKNFPLFVFASRTLYEPVNFPMAFGNQRFGVPYLNHQDSSYIAWRTADRPAYVPKFDEVKDAVLAAWKFQKARALAKKEAEELQARATKAGPTEASKVLREESYKYPQRGLLTELDNVAALVPKKEVFVRAETYEPYKVPEAISYPRPNFVSRLLTLTEEGQGTVLPNRPESIYYVAILLKRSVPTEASFLTVYEKTPVDDALWTNMERERRRTFREDVIKSLRAQAGPVDKRGRIELTADEEVRKALEGRGASELEE